MVLAGGRGQRMGAAEKGLLLFQGKPLFMHAAERLLPQVGTLFVNANRQVAQYAKGGFPVFSDDPVRFSGPLDGFRTGLRHCATPWLMVVPCDSPFLPDDMVSGMLAALFTEKADVAVAATIRDNQSFPHPVFCLMPLSLLPHLDGFLQTGQRKVATWLLSLKVAYARFAEQALVNINTPEELRDRESFHELNLL